MLAYFPFAFRLLFSLLGLLSGASAYHSLKRKGKSICRGLKRSVYQASNTRILVMAEKRLTPKDNNPPYIPFTPCQNCHNCQLCKRILWPLKALKILKALQYIDKTLKSFLSEGLEALKNSSFFCFGNFVEVTRPQIDLFNFPLGVC